MSAEERVSYRDKLAEAAKDAFADRVDAEGARLLSGNPWQALERALAAAAAVRDAELDRLSEENDRLAAKVAEFDGLVDDFTKQMIENGVRAEQAEAAIERARVIHDCTCSLRQAIREHPDEDLAGATCEMCAALGQPPAEKATQDRGEHQ